MPDPKRFSEIISAVLARAEKGQRRVRIFGEMVDRLWKEGKRAAAIYLEDLWNHLNTPPTRPFTLFCAYSIHNFDGEAHELSFSHICRQHSRVQPDESYISLTNSNERLRNIAALQQKANSLEAEAAAHRQTKVALQEAGARFRFLAETMPQKICTAKPNGDVDYFNPQWAEFTGLPLDEISGWNWQQFIHPEDVEKTVTHWQHSLVTGEPFYFEHRFRRADGVYRWHVSRAIPVYDDGGNIYMWIASNTDIDEQKRLEERKDEFISMASHELKTPVTSLKGFTQILQKRLKSQVDPQTMLFLERMEAQIEKLASLINDLLDVSKMQKGILTFRESNFDFDEMIRETIENVQASTKTHHLSLQGETHASVFGDRNRLGQVLINLLTNAIKYSPQSNDIIVRLNKHDEQVEVAVQDFGLGIDKAYHAHIFDRFYQVPGLQEKTYSGLGIGLYISHTIIERHGGRLWLESQKGAGSTFYFTVPSLRRTQEISHLQREEK